VTLATTPATTGYRIGAGDVVAIDVYGEDDLSPQVRIREDGVVQYPFLGALEVIGLTTDELARLIHDGLEGPYLVDPQVSVSIAEYRPFYISGQVQKPGSYPYEPGLTARKAITLAGGITDRASSRKIYITGEPANQDRRQVGLDDLLRPGDVLTIEESFF